MECVIADVPRLGEYTDGRALWTQDSRARYGIVACRSLIAIPMPELPLQSRHFFCNCVQDSGPVYIPSVHTEADLKCSSPCNNTSPIILVSFFTVLFRKKKLQSI